MKTRNFSNAQDFLEATSVDLESREAANSLVLGVCDQVIRHPERFQQPVCLKVVEEDGRPVLAAIMTPPRSLLLAGKPDRLEQVVAALASSLTGEGWNIPGVFGPKGVARAMIARLSQNDGKQYRLDRELRMYELKEVGFPPPIRGRLRRAALPDLERIAAWWYAAAADMNMPAEPEETRKTAAFRIEDGDVFVWEEGEPVSMASKTRPTKNGISVGMVYTPPDRRRQGYATACVGELSRLLLQEGRSFCSLYADLSNPISNGIYRKIGYRPIGDYEEFGRVDDKPSAKPAPVAGPGDTQKP
jgi:predicted GNAT family acetyltransferase